MTRRLYNDAVPNASKWFATALTRDRPKRWGRIVPTLTIQLPRQNAQTAFNSRRWAGLLADAALGRFEGRIETDRHGRVIMSPPPAPHHGSFQTRIAALLDRQMQSGRLGVN